MKPRMKQATKKGMPQGGHLVDVQSLVSELTDKRGLSQADVARRTGVSTVTVWRWYHGAGKAMKPYAELLRRLLAEVGGPVKGVKRP